MKISSKGILIASIVVVVCIVLITLFSRKGQVTKEYQKLKSSRTDTINWIGHWIGEGKREQMVREVANEFEFRNQYIKVNLQFPESVYFQGQDQHLGTADGAEINFIIKQVTAKNSDWDIIRLKDHYPKVAAKLNDPDWGKKYLVDFSEIQVFKDNHQDFVFTKEFKDANGGITIGPYNEGFYYAVWFNKELAKKIGINIKQFGMTPEDLVSYIKAVYDYNKANNTSIIPMFEENSWVIAPMLVNSMFYSLVGDYMDIINLDYNPKKLEYLEQVLNIFEEMAQYNPLPKNRSEITWSQTFNYPLDEKCLIYAQGSWMYTIWNNIDKVKLRNMIPAELPLFNGNSSAYIGGYKACWAVPKNARHKDDAIKLLTFWSSKEMAEKWVRYTKCPTAVKGSLTATTLGFDQFEDFQYYITKKYGLHMLNPVDNSYYFGLKNANIQIPVMDILEKKQTVKEVMKNIRKQIKK
jgi:ABC-type glycerol-3-phosphate transport system substrate-binding protein